MICDCLEEEDAVLWLFRKRLGKVVDTKGVNVDIIIFLTGLVKYFRVSIKYFVRTWR